MADKQADVEQKKAKVTNLEADTLKKRQEARRAAAETGTAIAN